MSATCSRCGDCCSVVILPANMVRSASTAVDAGSMAPGILWYRDDLRLLAEGEALARRPGLSLPYPEGAGLYECRHFDYVTRLCTNHENRPPVCQDFPWYGRGPRSEMLRDLPRCSYWQDVPFFEVSEDGHAVVSDSAVPA